jgi:SAM-dependent methyltransferase
MKTSQPEFGELFRGLRKRQPEPLSDRKHLGSKLGVTEKVLAEVEAGRMPPPPSLIAWCEEMEHANLPPLRESRDGILDALVSLRDFPAGSKILDIPCGPGRLTWELRKKGCEVIAADLLPEHFDAGGNPAIKVDMNHPFPFEDDSFDFIFSAEGIEHLENPWQAFREFARILKPGGELIVTTPNYSNIERRVGYLFKGSAVRPPAPEERCAEGMKSPPHLSAFPACHWKMSGDYAGLELVSMQTLSPRRKQWGFYPLALLIAVGTRLASKTTAYRYDMKWTQRMKILMGGRSLLMVFRKRG